jgi:hypothetical protein
MCIVVSLEVFRPEFQGPINLISWVSFLVFESAGK